MKGIIYLATCLETNKVYIGQTKKKLSARQSEHLRHAKNGSNTYFHRALLRYNFIFKVIETIDTDNIYDILNEREIYWINYYDSTNKKNGYNLSKGGRKSPNSKRKPFSHLEITKNKIRKAVSGEKNPMFGKTFYERWVEVYGLIEADKLMIEYREKHKITHGGNNNGMFGKIHSSKSKAKMSKKAKKRIGHKANRYIEVDMILLSKLINENLSKKDIAKKMGVSYFVISKRIKELNN